MLAEQSQNIVKHSTACFHSRTGSSSSRPCTNPSRRCQSLITASILTYGLSLSLPSSSSPFVSAFTSFSTSPRTFKNDLPFHQSNNIRTNFQYQHSFDYLQQRNKQALQMSSIDRDPNENNRPLDKVQSWIESKLPSPPEDQLALGGDVASIFFYTFLDHAVNSMYDDYLSGPEVIVTKSASAAIESSYAATAGLTSSFTQATVTGNSFPVWFDSAHSAPFGDIPLSAALPISHHIQYAPAIDTAGMASVLLCSTWMMCGYFTGAFQFKNTLECSTSRAIIKTAQTWFFTCILMFAIAYESDYLVGSFDSLHKSVGLTIADGDYILDSLSVLLMWRFLINFLFGSGGSDDDNQVTDK